MVGSPSGELFSCSEPSGGGISNITGVVHLVKCRGAQTASAMLLWLKPKILPTPFIATPVSNRIEDFLGYATLIFNDSRAWSLENLENLVGSRLIQTMGTCVSAYLWKTNWRGGPAIKLHPYQEQLEAAIYIAFKGHRLCQHFWWHLGLLRTIHKREGSKYTRIHNESLSKIPRKGYIYPKIAILQLLFSAYSSKSGRKSKEVKRQKKAQV